MQTIVIWCSPDDEVSFFVVDRDVSHLDRKYVGGFGSTSAEEEEIALLAYTRDGKKTVEFLSKFPATTVSDGAKIIVTGFLP